MRLGVNIASREEKKGKCIFHCRNFSASLIKTNKSLVYCDLFGTQAYTGNRSFALNQNADALLSNVIRERSQFSRSVR